MASGTENNPQEFFWNAARLTAGQLIWGEGFCGPGGPRHIIDSSKLLALAPKMSVLIIGTGAGGPSRVLAEEFGVWITGCENDQFLAEEAVKLSAATGLGKKLSVIHGDLNNLPPFDQSFDRAFSAETLFTVKDKADLFRKIYQPLKDDGLFLVSDFVIKDHDSLNDPDIINWQRHELPESCPVTPADMTALLENTGFTVTINEDITDHYLDLITIAWEQAGKALPLLAGNSREKMIHLHQESILWQSRTKALRSGKLRLQRYLAHKSS